MLEKEYDKKILKNLIKQLNELNKEINFFGEDIIKEHSRGLILRRNTLLDFVKNYAALYVDGLAYAERLDIKEIERISKKI